MQYEHPPLQLLALRDREALARAARRRANELRDQAQQDFWEGLGHALRQARTALRHGFATLRPSTR